MKAKIPAEKNNTNLRIISNILCDNKIGFFPFYGTLLGLVRENSCIEGDDDVDLMINIKEKSKVYVLFLKKCFKLTVSGENFLQFAYMIEKQSVVIDFYFYEEREDFLVDKWNFFGREKERDYFVFYDKRHFFPLKEIEWGRNGLLIPLYSEDLIEYCYGKKWKTPQIKGIDYCQKIQNNKIVVQYN